MNHAVRWPDWEPVYEAILADFGFDRTADERARDELAEHLRTAASLDTLPAASGATVAIAGAGPNLEAETDVAATADLVIAASTAARRLETAGVGVDVHVTDLDKDVADAVDRSNAGLPVAVHAHGDNRDLLAEHLPAFDHGYVLPTTQAAPVGPVVNIGGFTDGDRAAFLAHALGAHRLCFPGWSFDDPSVTPIKARKLVWAERLLGWLETIRDEEFAVLDGRRSGIDMAAFPS